MQNIKKFMRLIGNMLCMAACLVAPMASEVCRGKCYQPEEPEGLEEFVRKKKKM